MWWLVVAMVVIALIGAIAAAIYAIILWHKASDLMFEMQRVGSQLASVAELAGQLKVTPRSSNAERVD